MRTLRLPQKRRYIVLALFFLLASPVIADRLGECLSNSLRAVRDGQHGDIGSDDQGRTVADRTKVTSLPYKFCIQQCGKGPGTFDWIRFSQQSGAWLLPWLALVSQLPFGSNDNLDNFASILLTLGSPALAAYSLALTALNRRWIVRRFASYQYPNIHHAIQILDNLQQSPVVVNTEDSLLASLIILPENDDWWNDLAVSLDYSHTWSISTIASILWVVIAYAFTMVNSFINVYNLDTASVNSTGQGIGSLWTWLLPIVIGWHKISPKCDANRVSQAVMRANNMAYVATVSEGPVLASSLSGRHAISLAGRAESSSHPDASFTVPIYNYARFLSWVSAVEQVLDPFRAASERTRMHQSVNPDVRWKERGRSTARPHPKNRRGNRTQVDVYCSSLGEPPLSRTTWGPDIFPRIVIASGSALLLQWGTITAAVIPAWFTPTTGLGCRSGGYILYASVSTTVWMVLVLSSFLSHFASAAPYPKVPTLISSSARPLSLSLHRIGTILATCNAVWIVVLCLLQFSNVFESCYCYSSVMGRGIESFTVVECTAASTRTLRGASIGGVVLASGSVIIFAAFVNSLVKLRLPG